MGENPTIGDTSENGKVIEFRIPHNWVPTKLRPKLPTHGAEEEAKPGKAMAPETRQSNHSGLTVTQTDIAELERLRDAYRKARRAVREMEDYLAWNLLHGGHVEPGRRVARLTICNRPPKTIRGASYYRLVAR